MKLVLTITVSAVVGGVIGYIGQCTGGTCPLVCNPFGGIMIGAIIGSVLGVG